MEVNDVTKGRFSVPSSLDDPFRERWPEPADDFRQRFVTERPPAVTRWPPAITSRLPLAHKRPLERRLETYWRWFAVVLFVIISLDMLTTMYATNRFGLGAEANPLVRLALKRGVLDYTLLNLAGLGVSIGAFTVLTRVVRDSEPPYSRYFELVLKLWLGSLLVVGLFVLANNLLVILYGQSLV